MNHMPQAADDDQVQLLLVCPQIGSTDVDDLRLLGEWHEVSF